ncbi:TadE/TadG family type IV pilus assembly protein [Oceaniglobus ichthyenteri]|uniref:TadE/TadG family type IV pilus assembly protein n=1 Tax=Oceaniglobus ichthyenteri TaxID=2136177 RepID=UPI000D33695E|nr:hypothetical protein [Oceaniglobus ichthyenteri]
MKTLTYIQKKLRLFTGDENGSYAIETALIVPMLLWGMLATYTFVDGYRMQALNLRATYTISDLLTRQWNPVDQDFMTGLGRYHEFLTNDSHDTKMRITVVYYLSDTDEHKLVWSYSNDASKPKTTKANLKQLKDAIPVLANADTAIIVETWMDYKPPFAIGLSETEFANRVITSPRFVPQLLWTGSTTS